MARVIGKRQAVGRSGHVDVGEEHCDIGPSRLKSREGLCSVLCFDNLKASLHGSKHDELADHRFILQPRRRLARMRKPPGYLRP